MSLLKSALCAALCLLAVGETKASPVQTTITATVGSQYSGLGVSSLGIGDTVTFVFRYGDASTSMHIYNADGSIQETFSLLDHPEYFFFSDTSLVSWSDNIGALFNELGITYHQPGKYYYDLANGDGQILYFQSASNAEYSLSLPDILGRINDNGYIYLQPKNQEAVGFNLLALNSVTTPIPEPTTIALVALGLAGLGFSRRKKA